MGNIMLKLFKISAISSCGTYFSSYLQSVTVQALDKNQALQIAIQWAGENEGFIRDVTIDDVEELRVINGVVDYLIESDY